MLVVFHVIDSDCVIYYFCYAGGVKVLVIVQAVFLKCSEIKFTSTHDLHKTTFVLCSSVGMFLQCRCRVVQLVVRITAAARTLREVCSPVNVKAATAESSVRQNYQQLRHYRKLRHYQQLRNCQQLRPWSLLCRQVCLSCLL